MSRFAFRSLFSISLYVVALTTPFASPSAASAQHVPVQLEDLVVTASGWAEPEWMVTANTTVLDGQELENSGVEYVADALRAVPGLSIVRTGSPGSITSVFLRGGESDHVLVLVDGVRVNNAGGGIDLSALTTDNVERIEVLRGPNSSLYGSDAVSGVIQIFTRRRTGPPRGTVSLQGGSFGSLRWQGSVSGGDAPLSYAFSAGGLSTDGILEFNNQSSQTTLTGRVQAALDAHSTASISMRYNDKTYHFPTDGAGNVVDRNAFSFFDDLALEVAAERRFGEQVDARIFVDLWESENGSDDQPDDAADSLGFFGYTSLTDTRRVTWGGRARWRPSEGFTLSVGAEQEELSIRDFNQSQSQFGPSAGNSDAAWGNRAYHAHLTWGHSGLAINGGLRGEDNERFGSAVTWRTGLAWRLEDSGTRVRASAGTGIKEPTFFETHASGFVSGNPDLTPETSTSFEAGVEQRVATGVTFAVTGFRQGFRDLIQYTGTPPQEGGPNFFNVAEASSKGLEMELQVELGRVRTTVAHTFLDTEVIDSGFQEGEGATFVEGEPPPPAPSERDRSDAGFTGH